MRKESCVQEGAALSLSHSRLSSLGDCLALPRRIATNRLLCLHVVRTHTMYHFLFSPPFDGFDHASPSIRPREGGQLVTQYIHSHWRRRRCLKQERYEVHGIKVEVVETRFPPQNECRRLFSTYISPPKEKRRRQNRLSILHPPHVLPHRRCSPISNYFLP